jgi:predicted aspartyl protease
MRMGLTALLGIAGLLLGALPVQPAEGVADGAPTPPATALAYDARDDGLLRVSVEINGQPVRVVLDSAADRIYLPKRVADRLELEPTGRSLDTTTGSGDVRTDLLEIQKLTIGGHELRGLIAGVAPSLTYALVGQSVLSCFRWSVDPGARTVALERISGSPHCGADS